MFSFEVLPPLKGTGTANLFHTIDVLRQFNPSYINITTHRSEFVYTEQADGTFRRDCIRRRPGTIAVASAIMQKYNIKVVPHLVCSGFTAEDIEYMLLDLQFLGLSEIFLLRGDKALDDKRFRPEKGGYSHALQLIDHVNRFNEGFFIDGSPIKVKGCPFSYGVAAYPEKHEEAPNLDFDIQILRQKQDKGARYAVTQLFFDNRKYFDFVVRAREAGVTIPIIPGIKPLVRHSQLAVIPKTFHVDIPQALTDEVCRLDTDEQVKSLGIEWCVAQCRELLSAGVPSIHFYTMSATDSIQAILKQLI